jgi:hypothetical protein
MTLKAALIRCWAGRLIASSVSNSGLSIGKLTRSQVRSTRNSISPNFVGATFRFD